MADQEEEKRKPSLFLLSGQDALNLDDLIALFRALTGREPTDEEIAEAKAELESED